MPQQTQSDPTRLLVVLLVLFAGAFAARRALGIEWSTDSVRDFVAGFGLLGPLLFVALVGLRPFLMIPSQILLVAGGVCFGPWLGTVSGAAGMLVSGSAAFWLARRLGRQAVEGRFPASLDAAMRIVATRWGALFIALGTAYPVGPVTAYHAGAGLSAMPGARFLAALTPGALARAALFTFFGASLMGGSTRSQVLAGGALLLVLLVPLAHSGFRRRMLDLVGRPAASPPPDSRAG